MLVAGGRTGWYPGRNTCTAVPGSEYHVIEGAPHNVYYEAAAAYNARVDAFLAKVG